MKSSVKPTGPEAPGASPNQRRSLLLGAGAAGAAVLAARAWPTAPADAAAPGAAAPEAAAKGGYQLTQHVLRYYETTKV